MSTLVPREPRPFGQLPAPIFEHPGPYSKGTEIPVVLHLRSNTDEKDLVIEFSGEGLTYHQERFEVDHLEKHIPQYVRAVATVTGDAGPYFRSRARVLGTSTGTMDTADAIGEVYARSQLRLTLDGDALVMGNDGDTDATVTLSLSKPAAAFEDIAFDETGRSTSFALAAGTERRISVG